MCKSTLVCILYFSPMSTNWTISKIWYTSWTCGMHVCHSWMSLLGPWSWPASTGMYTVTYIKANRHFEHASRMFVDRLHYSRSDSIYHHTDPACLQFLRHFHFVQCSFSTADYLFYTHDEPFGFRFFLQNLEEKPSDHCRGCQGRLLQQWQWGPLFPAACWHASADISRLDLYNEKYLLLMRDYELALFVNQAGYRLIYRVFQLAFQGSLLYQLPPMLVSFWYVTNIGRLRCYATVCNGRRKGMCE